MLRVLLIAIGWVLIGLGGLPGEVLAGADDRTPDAILKELDARQTSPPDPARRQDAAYLQAYHKDVAATLLRQAELIDELARVAPDHPRLAQLFPARWSTLSGRINRRFIVDFIPRDVNPEIDEVAGRTKDPALKRSAAYFKAYIASDPRNGIGSTPNKALKVKAVEDFIASAPDDDRGPWLLANLTDVMEGEPTRQIEIYQRIVRDYPKSPWAKTAGLRLLRGDSVGKEFRLKFRDAIGGGEIDTADLCGQVVVVDFWATWCVPCLEEMPRMKDIYAKYHGKGVAFVGISLDVAEDKGGLTKLKDYAARNAIPWPQYYQGKGWDGEFSRSFGIVSIPAIFLIDQAGKVASVDAGEHLEESIAQLLDRKPKADDR